VSPARGSKNTAEGHSGYRGVACLVSGPGQRRILFFGELRTGGSGGGLAWWVVEREAGGTMRCRASRVGEESASSRSAIQQRGMLRRRKC